MDKSPKYSYAKEFRSQVVTLVLSDGLLPPEAAHRLSMSTRTLGDWIRAERKEVPQDISKRKHLLSDLESELARVKRELVLMTMERDILKRATLYSRISRSEIWPN